ncbi:MAG: isoprenylcysteine carboxylmethyltransferase family protein [Candidatus Bathyarchaeia archaeon]
MHRRYGFIVVTIVILFLIYAWISRFGPSIPPSEGYVPLLRGDAWFLVCLGLIATALALFSLFLEFRLSRSAAFVGWVLYFPVLFNTLVPMFILFFSVIGVFYTPWLLLTDLAFANRLISGIIRLPNDNATTIIEGLGYIFIIVGLAIYSLSLYQLLSHARKGRTLLTRGLYSVARHPQYLGIFLWTLGFAISGWRLINYLMWLTLCYSYMFLAEYEEAELEKTFGQKYIQYKSKVSFIIPCLKLDAKLFSRIVSERKIRLLAYTIVYVSLLVACYHIIDPYVVMYR